jgi:hypothetical protein
MIIGYNGEDAKAYLENIFDNTKKLQFPPLWENTIELLTSEKHLQICEAKRASEEFKQIEAKIKSTSTKA